MNTLKVSSTRLRIIQSAAQLFHKRGVRATSVDDVLNRSNAGKGQFYHYFKSKEALTRDVLKFYSLGFCEKLPDTFQSLDQLERWLHIFVQRLTESGCRQACPVGSIGVELAENEVIRQDVQMFFMRVRNALVIFFGRLKDRREIEGDPTALANFILTIIQGGLSLGKIDRATRPLEDAIASALAYLRSQQP